MRYIIKYNINNSKFEIGIVNIISILAISIVIKLDIIINLCQAQNPNSLLQTNRRKVVTIELPIVKSKI